MKLSKKHILIVLSVVVLVLGAYVIYAQLHKDNQPINYGNTPEERLRNGDPVCADKIAC
jgi:hypothetical protein